MTLRIEQISDTLILIHDGATNVMEIDSSAGVRINSSFRIGTDLVSPSASELAAIDGLTASSAELNYLDIATLGTGAASKAVVLDTGDDYTWPSSGILKYGVLKDSANTTLTATASQLNSLVGSPTVGKISETVPYASFTDGGAAVGTFAMTAPGIPASAVVLYAVVTAVTGFTGDTSAALAIGDGTDVDRYNTGTYDVFVTAATGIDVTDPSGLRFHLVTKTPTLTITKATDWGAGTTGSVTVDIFYLN